MSQFDAMMFDKSYYGSDCEKCSQRFVTFSGGSKLCDECLCITKGEEYTKPKE